MTNVVVTSLQGKAWAKRPDGEVIALEEGDSLNAGDIIVTAEDSRVALQFDDGRPAALLVGAQQVSLPEEQGQGDASSVDFLGREDVSKLLELIAEGSTDILEALEEPSAGGGEGVSHDGFDFVRLMRITETSGSQSYSFGDPFIVESAGHGEVGSIADDMDDSDADSGAPSIEFEDGDGGATAGFHSAVEGSQAFVAGRFTVSAPAGVASISVGRRDIAGTSDESPLVLEGEHGTLTITGFNPESGIVTYQYTENGLAANHAAGDGSVFDRFDIVVTDSTGETVSESLDINIIDTAPDANDDSAALGEEAVTAISGNVLDNDSAGADSMTFDGFTGNASASYGSFIHNDDGSWSYRVDPDNADVQALKDNQTLKETFSYTLTDADGDTSSATLTITINGSDDDVPTIEIPDGNEPGGNEPDGNEPDGSDPNGPEVVAGDHSVVEGSGATVTGSMTVAADAGIKQVSLTDQSGKTVDITGASTGPGAPKSVVVEGKHGSVTVTDYDAASGKITYSYTENGERADHSDDATVLDSFALTVTDNEGDSTSANLEINILDTSPAAVADTTETAENTAKTYNVLTNNDGTSDTKGDDGAILTKASVRGGEGVGTVAIASNGEITFTPAGAFEGDAVIDYTITDGDGDKSSSTLTVKVAQDSTPSVPGDGDNPTTQSPKATVDEDGLAGGNAGGSGDVAGEATVVKGELGYRFGDDGAADSNAFQWNLAGLPDDLKTVDGREVSFERSTDGHTLTGTVTDSNSEKEPVITITMADEAEGKYKVTLHQALEHAAGDDENDLTFDIGYTVKDADGSEVQGKLSVLIDDDSPVAVDDSVTQSAAQENQPVTVKVLANDAVGADGGRLTNATEVVADGASSKGSVSIDKNTGEVTFTPNAGAEGPVEIRYTLTDGDGDTSVGTLSVTLAQDSTPSVPGDGDNPTTQSPTATVDEDGLSGGNAGGSGDVAGEATVVKGELGYRLGDDGAADSNAFQWNLAGLPDDLKTADGREVSFERSPDGHTLTGTVTDSNSEKEPVITITLDDEATGDYTVTLHQALEHAAGDDENDLTFDIGYTVTDADGSEVQGKLSVQIDDDSPVVWEAEQAQLKSGQTGEVRFEAGADDIGKVTFSDVMNGTEVTSVNGGTLLTSNGEVLTYQLSDDGKTLEAKAASGGVAFKVSLSADGSTYEVEVIDEGVRAFDDASKEISEGSKHVVREYGTDGSGSGHRFIAFDGADGAADVVASAWTYRGPWASWLRTDGDTQLAAGHDDLTGLDEAVRLDFVDNLRFSDTAPSWDNHRGITHFSQFINAENGTLTDVGIKAIASAPDGTDTSGHPVAVSGHVLELAKSDVRLVNGAGKDITSLVTIEENADGTLNVRNIPADAQLVLTTGEAFEAIEFRGLDGTRPFSVGDFAYSEAEKDPALSLSLAGTDGDGDTADGSLTLSLPDDDQLLVGGGGDDSITGGSGNDVVLGDAGGKHSVLEPAKDYNLSFIVDVSPSMGAVLENGNSRFKVAIEAIRAKLTELADFEGTIHVQIVAFGGKYSPSIAFNDFSPEDMGDVNEFLDSRAIISGTNFEQAFVTATEWVTDVSRSGFNNVAYFMTDGQPNSHNYNGQIGVSDAGNITTYKDVTNALEGYKPLAAISRVEAIGIGDDVGRDFLKIFDNTADGELEMVPIPLESGASVGSTEMLATFDTGDTGRLASIDNWSVETTNGHIAIDRTPVGTYLRVRDSGTGDGSTVATSDAIVLEEPAGANRFYTLSFDYVTDTPNDFEKEGNPSDRFSWSLEMQNEEGGWDVVATSLPILPSGNINSSSTQIMANGLKGGTYRLQFEVENAAGNFFSLLIHDISLDLYSYTDDQLVPAGEVAIVNSAEEFATALDGGSSFDQPADLGGDSLDGGAGDDVLFGDQIDPAGVGGEAGSGYAGLVDYLTTQNSGTEPTQKEILAFIKDNYEALSGDSSNDGGQDRIDGGKGNDQLFAGSGDDVLIGGAGDDLLLGGLGSDTFQWSLGDVGSTTDPAHDTVSDFHVKDAALSMDPEADKLALGDLLNDFDSTSTDPDQSALDSFIFAQEENGDTVLYIKSDGGLDVQHSNADQKITLDGVSMEGQSSEAFLTMLRNNGQLDVE
ncbi:MULTISPECIES: retention module-containing protein [unclassified Halomonas]|uniref:retention module-containing protein n=1 Tax=unclassified Halomonas TaxID=2609666 RepID=UPI0012EE082E|nr:MULTISPECIES: retention module-containing protein [unclassified Halomonas]MCO7216796.1 retention module-containing protein [Halomonas sp. OfavH-34-E]